jgi:hypothetical protein
MRRFGAAVIDWLHKNGFAKAAKAEELYGA